MYHLFLKLFYKCLFTGFEYCAYLLKQKYMISFMCPSGLLLDAFAQRWEDAVCGAPAACSSHLASRIPVSRQQEGAVLFPQSITNRGAAPSPLYSPFQTSRS